MNQVATNKQVVGTTYVRRLREGDKFIEYNDHRGRRAVEDGNPTEYEIFTVRKDPEVIDGDTVKVFLETYKTGFLYEIDARVKRV